MDMVYVKIWLDWDVLTKKLKDAEKGRLIDAIVAYAKGDDPEVYLSGNEQFLFPAFQSKVDRDRAELEGLSRTRSEAGRKGGRPPKANASDEKQKNQMLFDESKKSKEYRTKNIEQRTEIKADTGDIPPVTPPAFDRFWSAYPKKTGKGAAQKAFERITGVPVDVMLYAIEQQRHSRQWQEDNGRFIPNPATWLNQRRWEDEPEAQALPQRSGNIFADLAREGVFEDG